MDQTPLRAGLARLMRAEGGEAGVSGLRRLSGGASQETWSFDVQRGGVALPLILRRAPLGAEARAAIGGGAGLAAEAELLNLTAAGGVPVPKVHALLRPADELGEGFVMARLEGETLGRKITADARFAGARERLAFQCGEALARIHRVETGGSDVLRAPGGLRVAPAAVELELYLDTHRQHGTVKPVFELAFRWLRENLPPPPERHALVHGDFRNGNLIVDEQGLRAVLDWELAHLGDGMEDLGWMCVNSWRFGRIELPVGGFGTREQLFAGYEAAGGRVDPARVHYWEVLGTLKWGVICEGMAHAHLSGAERNVEKAAIGRRASETEIDLLNLLAPRAPATARAA